MARQPDFDRKVVRDAIISAGGNIARAAKILDAERKTVYNYINRFKSLRGVVEKERQNRRNYRLDLAENNLDAALEAGEWRATEYVLSTLGKHLGYTRTVNINEEKPVEKATIGAAEWIKKTEDRAKSAGIRLTQ